MNNFWARTITGLSMVFLLLFSLWYNHWFFEGIFLVVVILGLWEFYTIFTSGTLKPQKVYGTACGVVLFLSIIWCRWFDLNLQNQGWYFLPVIISLLAFFLSFIIEIFRKQINPLPNVAVTVLGIFYIALPLGLLVTLNSHRSVHFIGFPAYLLGYFILTWFYDTGAYLFGKRFGKHKLFERISPKKTWEGSIAGALVAMLTSVAFSYLVPGIALFDWLALAVLILFFGTFGDLVESLFKRSLNIKDSGHILPGHGGILDRFDTVFFSAPFVFLYFILRNTI
jgi:phosphatidate cytidylyltransferase